MAVEWPAAITDLWETLALAPRGLGAPADDRRSRDTIRAAPLLRGLPVREEAFTVPGWRLVGDAALVGGQTRLAAHALIGTAGTAAEGVVGVVRLLGPQSLWGLRPWARWGLLDPTTRLPVGYMSVRQDGVAVPQALPEGAAAAPHWTLGQEATALLHQWAATGTLVHGWLPVQRTPARQGVNLRLTAAAAPARCLIIAHYDTVYSTGGAYDNASGTVLAALLAHDLTAAGINDVDVALLDGEEPGLWGAQAYLRHRQEEGGIAPATVVLNLDGIGRGSALEVWLAPESMDRQILPLVPHLERDGWSVHLRFPPPPASDHAIFWAAGYPVVMVTIDDQDIIHRDVDRPDPAILSNMQRLYPHLLTLARTLGLGRG